jgi:hypothetical protein
MTTPIEIISRALKDIGALEAGEIPTPDASQDALDMLNDLIDQWSNEGMMIYNVTEIVFPLIAGQTQYTIGPDPSTANYIGASITGSIVGKILTVTNATTGAVALGQTLKGIGINGIATKIVEFLTGAGGNVNEAGTYRLNLDSTTPAPAFTASISGTTLNVTAIATGYLGVGAVISGTGVTVGTTITAVLSASGGVGTYTVSASQSVSSRAMTATITPIPITLFYQKPLGIDSAFVRINTTSNGQPIYGGGLDYQVSILALENYNQIGLKTLNGPWPKALYYNAGAESGNLTVWPNPSQGEMHLFTSTIYSTYDDLYENIAFPQGYAMCLRWNLAERLMPMYGKVNQTQIGMINAYAAQAKATLKRTNMKPVMTASYPDSMLSSRAKDAGWILNGGFTG